MRESWPDGLAGFVGEVRAKRLNLRIRMLGGSQSGYARLTRRWWAPVRATLTDQPLSDKPMYFVSSNTHSLVNLVTTGAGASEDEIVSYVEANGPDYLLEELERFRTERTRALGELPLLRRAPVLRGPARGRAGVGAPPPRRARARFHAHLLPHRPARLARR